MNCLIQHKINLTNLKHFDEVVNHPLLLLKGTVGKICKHKIIYLSSLSLSAQETEVSRSGEFKFLCNLEETPKSAENGLKYFKLAYCQQELSVRFWFRPRNTDNSAFSVQPLYIICKGHDGQFRLNHSQVGNSKDASRLIDLNLKLVQTVYAEKLRESGFPRRTFALCSPCKLFHSELCVNEAYILDEEKLWNYFASEILNSGFGDTVKVKFVAFIGCTKFEGSKIAESGDYSYINIRKHLLAHAALGVGGLALFGSGYFYAWPKSAKEVLHCFKNNSKVDLNNFPDDSNYRRTFAGVFASTLGAVCHEIGHIFDLGHTHDGVMGTGFDYLNRVFTVDNLTENLPKRLTGIPIDTAEFALKPQRFTRIRHQENSFLTKYHEQKQSDAFYFTRNCAVILAFHKWLNETDHNEQFEKEEITFDPNEKCIQTKNESLKLIEIRKNSNSFVEKYFEFSTSSVFKFQLPSVEDSSFSLFDYHLFIITTFGTIKQIRMPLADDA